MKPTQQEIDRMTHAFSSDYKRGFEDGIESLLNWQKSQPLTVYCVHSSESEIEGVFRSEEKAQEHIEKLKKHHNEAFWIQPTEI